jgi:hypothetical protein
VNNLNSIVDEAASASRGRRDPGNDISSDGVPEPLSEVAPLPEVESESLDVAATQLAEVEQVGPNVVDSLSMKQLSDATVKYLLAVRAIDRDFHGPVTAIWRALFDLIEGLEFMEEPLKQRSHALTRVPTTGDKCLYCFHCDGTAFNTTERLSVYHEHRMPILAGYAAIIQSLERLAEMTTTAKISYEKHVSEEAADDAVISAHLEHIEALKHVGGTIGLIADQKADQYRVVWSRDLDDYLRGLREAYGSDFKAIASIPGTPNGVKVIQKRFEMFAAQNDPNWLTRDADILEYFTYWGTVAAGDSTKSEGES